MMTRWRMMTGSKRSVSLGELAGKGLILIILLGLPFAAQAKMLKLEVAAVAEPMVIDGDPGEWKDVQVSYLEKSVRALSLAHDADNLYLMFRFSDRRLAQTIARRGILIWADPDAKKNQTFGVRYSGSVELVEGLRAEARESSRESGQPRGDSRGPRQERGSAVRRPGIEAIEPGVVTTFAGETVTSISAQAPGQPWASAAEHDGVLCFELVLPLALVGERLIGQEPDQSRRLALGLHIGGLTRAEEEEIKERIGGSGRGGLTLGGAGRRGAGMGRGGMGGDGMGGGARGGGRPGGSSASGRDGLDKEPTWLEVTLEPVAE